MRKIEFAVGKKKLELVAGLVWHPLAGTGAARAKEILAYAKASEGDFKVLRGTEAAHVGFAKKSEGGHAGQIAAAAVIADFLAQDGSGRNVLVALQLPDDRDTYMFVSVRDGVILADGDMLGTRDEIRVRLVGDVAYGGWDIVVCPGDWGISNSDDREFSQFFTKDVLKAPKKWALKDTTIAWKKAVGPVVLVIAVAVGGSYGWGVWTKKKEAAAAALRQQQEEVARGQRVTPTAPPKPWPLIPGVVSFAQACSQALSKAGLSAGNWQLWTIDCESGTLTISWVKTNERAWISHLKAVRPDAIIFADGMTASVSVPAMAPTSNDFSEALPEQRDISLRYYDLASRYGMAVRIDAAVAATPPVALPGQASSLAIPVAPPSWAELAVHITTSIDPVQVAAVLAHPGLRFKKINYVFTSGVMQYQLTGVQYVRP